jgi:hypothetical protein
LTQVLARKASRDQVCFGRQGAECSHILWLPFDIGKARSQYHARIRIVLAKKQRFMTGTMKA